MKVSFFIFFLFTLLVLGCFFAYVSGFVVVNPRAVPRVEVHADVVEGDMVWREDKGEFVLSMPNMCGKSDEELYQDIVRKFPRQEAYVDVLSLKDVAFILPDDDPAWHEIIFNHWRVRHTINIVFYNSLRLHHPIVNFRDAEEIMRGGGL